MQEEAHQARPGGATIMTRLAEMIVINALRFWMETTQPADAGWIAALRDPQIGRAVAAVHHDPAAAWSVDRLARTARLSRSRFAQRFSELVGAPPLQYVTRVRMERARETLQREKISVAELAQRFGYDSAPAFARAFKRQMGAPPGSIRRGHSRGQAENNLNEKERP
jgi:AraC-like DNA-binding protein